MIYTKTIETESGESEHQILHVTKGLIYRVEVDFPAGCAGLLKVRINDGGHQLYPSSPGETFHTDGKVIAFEDTYLKFAEPFQFDVYTENEDEEYPHTIQVRMGMVSEEIFMARFLPTYTYKYFQQMLREMQREQEDRYAAIREHPFEWIPKEEVE